MEEIFVGYLFHQHYLVAESDQATEYASEALIALANFANIRITAHRELASIDMLKVAEKMLGKSVPEPFYRGFPRSVFEMTPTELKVDKFLHYLRTYGMGDFSEQGHSLFETYYERLTFDEDVDYQDFAIITPHEAQSILAAAVRGFLRSTRPLNDYSYSLVATFIEANPDFEVGVCGSKDTAIRLLDDTRNVGLASLIKLSDVIRLLEWIIAPTMSAIFKLKLKNRDRVFITSVIRRIFELGRADVDNCLEKKKIWCGLLHHLHYKPTCDEDRAFCDAIRGKDVRSAYSAMDRYLSAGDVRAATDALKTAKGAGAVLRHLNHLLSRIDMESDPKRAQEDMAYVLDACQTTNKIMLIQLITDRATRGYTTLNGHRVFRFTHSGRMRIHKETDDEVARRKTLLSPAVEDAIDAWLDDQFASACQGRLGKAYIADEMKNVALPLQESVSMGGFNTLPRGTRIPLPPEKKVRAFTYWEKVRDIDLSCLLFDEAGNMLELSWRTYEDEQSEALVFSGDQTSGFYGGSEYFDVNVPLIAETYGTKWRYLVFCDNVYSFGTFRTCVCRAGYMLRDLEDSGEIFEPATVKTSYPVTSDGKMAYLFAIDLHDPAIIWLNIAREGNYQIAATSGAASFVIPYLHITEAMNLSVFARALADEVVDDIREAEVVFSDANPQELGLRDDQELISSRNTARILELLN